MLQYTSKPQSNQELLFYLFDQKRRHENIRGIFGKVRNNQDAFDKFAELALSKDFLDKLNRAQGNPTSKEAKEVLREVMPVLHSTGKATPFGAIKRNASLAKVYAMNRRYAGAFVFFNYLSK